MLGRGGRIRPLRSSLLSTSCIFESAAAEGGGREAGKQARSLGHLIQLLAILLWDHYTALLLSQSACLPPAR